MLSKVDKTIRKDLCGSSNKKSPKFLNDGEIFCFFRELQYFRYLPISASNNQIFDLLSLNLNLYGIHP